MPQRAILVATLTTAIGLTACQGSGETTKSESVTPAGGTDTVCAVTVWRREAVAQECTPGQRVAFLPDTWGNEQLPIMFASLHCDLSQSVVVTNGGVACVYKPAWIVSGEVSDAPAQAPAPNADGGTDEQARQKGG